MAKPHTGNFEIVAFSASYKDLTPGFSAAIDSGK
jgi:hypothetical protein